MTDTTHTRPKMNQNLLLFYSTICASVALSLVSGYETYLGLLDFMKAGIVGHIASTVLTFGIQVLLFVISWNIANHVRDGFKANIPRWAIWALCGFFSAYFSYYGFLYTTGGRNEDIRQQAIKSERTQILKDINDNFSARLTADHQSKLLDAPSYQDWVTGSLRDLIGIAANSQSQIAEAATLTREGLLADQTRARNRLLPLEKQFQQASVQLEMSRRDLVDVQKKYDEKASQVSDLKGQSADAAIEITALSTQLQTEIKTKCGPICQDLKVKINSAEARKNAIDQTLTTSETELRDLDRRKLELELLAKDDIGASEANSLKQQIESITAEIGDIEVRLVAATQGVQFNFDEQQKELESHLSALASSDYSAADQLTEQCSLVKQQLASTVLKDKVMAIQCSNSAVVETVATLAAMQAGQKAFAKICLDPALYVPFGRTEGSEETIVNPTIDQIADCVAKAEDNELRSELMAQVDTMKQQRGDNVDPITLASVALFSDHQGNAVMAAIFAVIVDVLVLLCALVGKNVGLPERVRAIDLMISRSRPVTGANAAYEKQLDLATLEPQQRALVEVVVSEMLRRDLMDYADGSGNVLLLKRGAIERLAALRNQEAGNDSETSGTTPAGKGPGPVPPRRRGLRN